MTVGSLGAATIDDGCFVRVRAGRLPERATGLLRVPCTIELCRGPTIGFKKQLQSLRDIFQM